MDIVMRNRKFYTSIFLAPYSEPDRSEDRVKSAAAVEDEETEDINDIIWDYEHDDVLEEVDFKTGPEGMFAELYEGLIRRRKVYDTEMKLDAENLKYKYLKSILNLLEKDSDGDGQMEVSSDDLERVYKEGVFRFIKHKTVLLKKKVISKELLDKITESLSEVPNIYNKISGSNRLGVFREKETEMVMYISELERQIKKTYDEASIRLLIEEAKYRRTYINLYERQFNVKLKFKDTRAVPELRVEIDDDMMDAYIDNKGYDSDDDYVMETNAHANDRLKERNPVAAAAATAKRKQPQQTELENKDENDSIQNNNSNSKRAKLVLQKPCTSLLAKARYKAEGITIYNEIDVKRPYKFLKNTTRVKCKIVAKKKEDKYEGATVLEPHKGYWPYPVSTLDFASLYPSIMQSVNMSHETKLSPEDIATHQYVEGKDYSTVVMGRVTKHYRFPLCRECTVGLKKFKDAGLAGFKCCPDCDEREIKKAEIKKNDWRENDATRPNGQYITILLEERKVSFAKKMCEVCFNCKECDRVRGECKGALFCSAHLTCDACPKYRQKAVLCEVIAHLLGARSMAKKKMKFHGEAVEKYLEEYIKLCDLPASTKAKDIPLPGTPDLTKLWLTKKKTPEDMAKLIEIYAKLKYNQDYYGMYNQWQMAFKVTCNSVYGFTGAKQGFLPDVDIASAVTGSFICWATGLTGLGVQTPIYS
jgi:hypothetical protein